LELLNGNDCSSCDWLTEIVSGIGRQSVPWAQIRTETEIWNDFSQESWTWNGLGSQTCSCVWNRMEIDDGSCCGYGCGSENGSGVHGIWTLSEIENESETCCCGVLSC